MSSYASLVSVCFFIIVHQHPAVILALPVNATSPALTRLTPTSSSTLGSLTSDSSAAASSPSSAASSTPISTLAAAAPEPELSGYGPWTSPCSSTFSSGSSSPATPLTWPSEMWDMLFDNADLTAPSTAQQLEDATVSLYEALDLAQSLQDEIFQVYLISSVARRDWLLAADPLVPDAASHVMSGDAEATVHADNRTQQVTLQFRGLSIVLIFLDQCREDEARGILSHPTLLNIYQQLQVKLLNVLCKLQEVLLAADHEVPRVPRSVLTSEVRNMSRIPRDFIVARDVIAVLQKSVAALQQLKTN